jgi:hypothetical protein
MSFPAVNTDRRNPLAKITPCTCSTRARTVSLPIFASRARRAHRSVVLERCQRVRERAPEFQRHRVDGLAFEPHDGVRGAGGAIYAHARFSHLSAGPWTSTDRARECVATRAPRRAAATDDAPREGTMTTMNATYKYYERIDR